MRGLSGGQEPEPEAEQDIIVSQEQRERNIAAELLHEMTETFDDGSRQTFALTFRGENITQDDVPSDLMDTPGSSYTVQNVQTGAIVLTIPPAGTPPMSIEYFRIID